MENELPEVEPLSSAARTVLKFVFCYTIAYVGLCIVLHIGTLFHRLRFEQLLGPLGFGMIPFFPIVPACLGLNAMSRQQVKAIMSRSPKWMRWSSPSLITYIPLLMIWHWINRPEEYSKEMDNLTPIVAGQMFSIAMAFVALYCLRLTFWRMNPQTPQTKP